jgi:hypothetical protein
VSAELERPIYDINRTNSASVLDERVTVSNALATRDLLRVRQGVRRELASASTENQGHSEGLRSLLSW